MKIRSIFFLALLFSSSFGQVLAACHGGINWLGNDAVNYDPDFSVRAHELGSLVTPSPDLATPIKTSKSKPRLAPDEEGHNQTFNRTGNQSSVLPQLVAKPIDLSGKWLVRFSDSMSRSIDLILLSAGANRTMGSGTLADEGARIPVTARGTIAGQGVTMTIKTVVGDYVNQIDREYDLDLIMTNNTLSGAYVLKSAGKFLGKGNATAMKQ